MPTLDVTTIPLPPQDFWGIVFGLGFIFCTALAYIGLTVVGKSYRPPKWEAYSPLTIALLLVLAVVWLALFALTIWAAFVGAYQMLHAPITTNTPSAGGNAGLGGLGLGALLTALLGAPFLIWATVIKQDTLAVSRQTLALSETALFNDKVNAALTGLYSRRQITRVIKEGTEDKVLTEWEDDIVQRNGAIDRLEGLARERPSEAPRIANMLSVYVRELSKASKPQVHPRQEYAELVDPISGDKGIPKEDALQQLGLTYDDVTVDSLKNWAKGLKPFRTDVEKAAQTLGRLRDIAGVEQDSIAIDLRGANMQGFDLNGLCFDKAKLQGARMEGADLREARLVGAYLRQTQLEGAYLYSAEMGEADLTLARMAGTDLVEARMERAYLSWARMEEASLDFARMEGADLSRVLMDGARLFEARMEGVRLYKASLEGADLSWAQLDAATNWTGSEVSKAHAQSVDFSNSPISMAQLQSMFGDASVTLPDGITPDHADWPAHWPKFELGWPDFDTECEKWLANPDTYTPPEPPP